MNKNARIKELEANLKHEAALIEDLIAGFAKTEADTKRRHGERIDAIQSQLKANDKVAAEAKKRAAEAETLKHIRNGMVPIAELRRIVGSVNTRTVGDLTNRTVSLEAVSLGDRSPIGNAILDALLAPEKLNLADLLRGGYAGGVIKPSPDFGSSYGAFAAATKAPRYKVGDRVNVQTLPNSGGFLVSGPIV